jgi:16S rRNA (adenine1518-N6/adenine1519-N6)-dimethyltransferase
MVFTLQLETAERLTAAPRTKAYGALSVTVQSLYRTRLLRRLPPQVFWPIPKVHSAVLEMHLRPTGMPPEEFASFHRFVRTAFGHRRKQLATCLAALPTGAAAATTAMEDLNLPKTRRAQELSVTELIALYRRWCRLVPPRKGSADPAGCA